ncbi:hypothetical protein CG51_05305 [Haematobacter missouriensis]|uniref:SAM-dependent methyltransferase n=1 Tax=Haematobacter missouriensis TaxID=366616 RepID=A0A212AHX6_9RHOB|nr:hypothetical protein [Haematobacter missouriensis]KFI34260.1 hypothetical protein CG51_05305 [Haematobacter missouriensis]OWJ72402.1 hypothetical protein CDV53_17550 [Haematobacter missouriensis]OWJ81094.1 hypothetical protein CDV52_19635 [Haematobacter missouriensis]
MAAPSTKALFRATKAKRTATVGQGALIGDLPEMRRGPDVRRDDDFYPTAQPEAVRALLSRDGSRIRRCGAVWENAVGDGALAREIEAFGLPVVGSDIVDRGWPGVALRSFYDYDASPARAIITNPPFCEINARDGRARWLRHTLDMPGWDYCAMLLSWDWPAAVINGLGELLDTRPFSYAYLMRWKLDFTGDGSPPQRNAWFVWDKEWRGEPAFRWLNRHDDYRQEALL